MANSWLRLWHDMPNDPKFRVVAKASNQPISLVMALYVAMLVDASKNNTSRGVTQCHDEDFAVTLDCDIAQIEQIKHAMQGRLLEGNHLSGWEKRQPKREDSGDPESGAKSAAERQAEKRERDRLAAEARMQSECHDESRKVTLDTDKSKSKQPSAKHEKIVFDGSSFKNINGQLAVWSNAYPAVDVTAEINKAAAWLVANPKNRKSQLGRFLNGWLSRAQDRAPRVASGSPDRFEGVI